MSTKKLYPYEFTDQEGGSFQTWTFGFVTKSQLRYLKNLSGRTIINGVYVHSLIFESASAGLNNYARWDCLNGWTTTLMKAKKNFPNGKHGEKHEVN